MPSIHEHINWRLSGFDRPQKPGFLRSEPDPLEAFKQDVESLIGTSDESNWRVYIHTPHDDIDPRTPWRLAQLRIFPRRGMIIGVVKDSPTISRRVYHERDILSLEMTHLKADIGS